MKKKILPNLLQKLIKFNQKTKNKILPTIELISQINFDQPIIIHYYFYYQSYNNENYKSER